MADLLSLIGIQAWPYADYVMAGLIVVLSFIAAKTVSGIIGMAEKRIVTRTKFTADDMLLDAVKGPVKAGILLFGIFLALEYLPGLAPYSAEMQVVYTIAAPLYVAYLASRLAGAGIDWYIQAIAKKTKTDIDDQFMPILKKAVYGIIFGLVILVVLNQLGIRVETLIAAMGIGGLAVALALQPTLSNFFSGTQMIVDRPLRIGDYVELESGDKGTIVDIGWRSTKIRTYTNNIVVLPNNKIADSRIINYNTPNSQIGFVVKCGVAYGSDLEKVERITLQVAREVLGRRNGVKGFEPLFRYSEFGDSSINFKVIMRTKTLGDKYMATHDFIKSLKKRFDSEGIEIPFPQLDVHAKSEEKPQPKHRSGKTKQGRKK